MNISFVISNVPGLIDDFTTRPPLEATTRDYLTEYILKTSPITDFALTRVNLLRQEILNTSVARLVDGTPRAVPGLRQNTQNETVQAKDFIRLQVALNLRGYQIYPAPIVLTDSLIAAVDSPEFTIDLRQSHSFYANATAYSATRATPGEVVPAPTAFEKRQISNAAVAVIVLIILCLVFSGAILYRKYGRRRRLKRDLPVETEGPPRYSTGSQRPNVFSFDLSPASSTGLGRLLAVFSSESGEATGPNSSEETAPSSRQSSEVEEHPLTGIIPSMVVIDNIDEADPNASMRSYSEKRAKKKSIVPTKRVEASKSFIEALNNSQHPSSLSDLW